MNISKKLLAKSVFLTKPGEDLATLDVYNKLDTSIVTKVRDIANLQAQNLEGLLSVANTLSSSFPSIVDSVGETLKINTDNLTARISALSRTVSSNLSQLGSDFLSKANLDKSLIGDVYSVVDGVKTKLGKADLTNLNALTETIQSLTSDSNLFDVIDLGAQQALYTSLITEASSLGIPNSFKAVVGSLNDSSVINGILKDIVPITIDTSDISMLSSLVDSDSSSLLKNYGFNVIEEFVGKFQFSLSDNIKEGFNSLMESFNKLDSNWNKAIIEEDKEVLDISSLLSSSRSFKEYLSTAIVSKNIKELGDDEENDILFLLLIKEFGKTTPRKALMRDYPQSVI